MSARLAVEILRTATALTGRLSCREGQAKGVQEGLDFGIRKGFELGSELGVYVGLVEVRSGSAAGTAPFGQHMPTACSVTQVWQALAERQPQLISQRTLRAVDALHQQLEALSARPAVSSQRGGMHECRCTGAYSDMQPCRYPACRLPCHKSGAGSR